MNTISAKKLLNSKWTTVKPLNKEKHFIVSDVQYDEDDIVISCCIEAVMTKRSKLIDWHDLKNNDIWIYGWK